MTTGGQQADLEASARRILGRHAAVGLATGLVGTDGLQRFTAHGLADIASGRPVTEDTVFRIGSITKTFTAIAVLQLVEEGRLDLDAPVAERLRSFRLVPRDPAWPPVTLRHLLTHTSGIGEMRRVSDLLRPMFSDMVRPGHDVPTLKSYYRRGLRVAAEPGTRWRYAGHGFAAAGQVVEEVTGQPLDRYLRERVFAPLGMTDTELLPSDRLRDRLATGYTVGRRGAQPVADPALVTAAAGAAWSTPRDMARYLAALLTGGANEHGRVLRPGSVAAMFAPQYRPDPRIPGMGLAFFRGEAGGHAVVEHGGVVPGSVSQFFLAPDDGVAVMAFTNGTRAGMFWLPGATAGLLNQVLDVEEAIRADVPQRPEVWAELCGRYRIGGPLTDVRARGMSGAGVDVAVRSGRLVLRVLTPVPAAVRGLPLHPDDPEDPYVFRLDLTRFGIGTARVVFGRHPAAVHFDRGQFLSARKVQA